MKKWLLTVFCILLSCMLISAQAAVEYTLPEKMQKQLDFPNGLKGTFTIHTETKEALGGLLLPFCDVEFTFRGMKSGKESHYYVYQADENETQRGLTELYCKEDAYYFRSDFLPDRVFCFPEITRLVDQIAGSEKSNPSFASILMRAVSLSEEQKKTLWEPFIDQYTQKLERWLAGFSETSTLNSGEKSGQSYLEMNYTIPMNELKNEILVLLKEIQSDAESRKLIESLMSKEQIETYFNENLEYYYLSAMDSLNDEYDVTFTRIVSTMGVEISSTLELPLDQRLSGFQSVVIHNENDQSSVLLNNPDETIALMIDHPLDNLNQNGGKASIRFIRYPSQESTKTERLSVRIDLLHTVETHTDTDEKSHQTDHWLLSVEKDTSSLPEGEKETDYPDVQPMSLDLTLHYSSKYAQSSPTNLNIDAVCIFNGTKIQIQANCKTASPWIFSPFDISNAERLDMLTDQERTVLLAEWLASASEQIKKISTQE